MTHKDYLSAVQKMCQLDNTHCSVLHKSLCNLMAKAAVEQIPVTIPGLGTFVSHKHPEYIQEDPATGQQTLYPPRITYRMHDEEMEGQQELLERQLAEHAKMPVGDCSQFIAALAQVIYGALDRGEEVEISGLGTFRVVASRQAELQRVAYTPDAAMREAVNAPFNCFEPVVIPARMAPVTKVAEAEVTLAGEPEVALADEPEVMAEPVEPVVVAVEPEVVEPVAVSVEPEVAEPQVVVSAASEVAAPVAAIEPKVVEPEPVAVEPKVVEPEPVAVEPKPVVEPVAAETKKKSKPVTRPAKSENSGIIRWLAAIVVIAALALGWLIWHLDQNPVTMAALEVDDDDIELMADDIDDDEPSPEVFFDEDFTESVVAEEVAEEMAETPVEPTEAQPAIVETKPAVVEQKPAAIEPKPATVDPKPAAPSAKPAAASANGRKKNADGTYATHTLQTGERLTLVALKYYGDKAFWPYVYEVNRDKLTSPSHVLAGMKLYLPDAEHFGINANDPTSVQKAKNKAAAILNGK